MTSAATSKTYSSPYKIAVIPGDGIGLEVMPPALSILQTASSLFNFELDLSSQFDFASCDYYEKNGGKMLPDDWVEVLGKFDCIYFGAVGGPKRVPDHISLWGSLLLFRRQFDQYVLSLPLSLLLSSHPHFYLVDTSTCAHAS